MTSTSADRRPTSGRLLLMAHAALGLFAVALALYLLVAAWPAADPASTYGARLVIAWAQVAALAAAATCWTVSRLAGRREHRSDRRWAAELGEWQAYTISELIEGVRWCQLSWWSGPVSIRWWW